jgi:hypothetical protein
MRMRMMVRIAGFAATAGVSAFILSWLLLGRHPANAALPALSLAVVVAYLAARGRRGGEKVPGSLLLGVGSTLIVLVAIWLVVSAGTKFTVALIPAFAIIAFAMAMIVLGVLAVQRSDPNP